MSIAQRLTVLAAAFCCAVSAALADAPRPNIVLILTDDQSPIAERVPGLNEPYAFGAYGGQVFTPNIDRMAAEGIRFDQANVAAPVCTPSRYNYLTGRYATRSLGPLQSSLSARHHVSPGTWWSWILNAAQCRTTARRRLPHRFVGVPRHRHHLYHR
jgi:hypothetical protein